MTKRFLCVNINYYDNFIMNLIKEKLMKTIISTTYKVVDREFFSHTLFKNPDDSEKIFKTRKEAITLIKRHIFTLSKCLMNTTLGSKYPKSGIEYAKELKRLMRFRIIEINESIEGFLD